MNVNSHNLLSHWESGKSVFTFFLTGGRANTVVLPIDEIQSCKWKELDVLGMGFLRQDLKN